METQNKLLQLKERLRNIEARITDPMASEESLQELRKTRKELEKEIEQEMRSQKLPQKTFERLLNEGDQHYGIK